MKSFEELYSDVIENSKGDLEKLRKSVRNRTIIVIIATILLMIVSLAILQDSGIWVGIIFIVCVIGGVIWCYKPQKEYTGLYKEKVVKRFITEYDKNLSYNPYGKVPSSTYRDAGFEQYWDRYSSDDLITGQIDGHKVLMGEVHTEEEHETTDSDGNTTTTYVTLFHGMFGNVEINNIYNGELKIHSDKGKLGRLFGNKTRVEMDSSEFEKYFDVYAEDKIQVMQVLTSDIMEEMIDFRKNHKTKYEITINCDQLYIRFHTGTMFEANVFKSSVNQKTLQTVYDIINFTFDITRKFIKVTEETEI